jgi:hypothetical protein
MSYALTTRYLEMTAPQQLVPAQVPEPEPRLEQACVTLPELNRFLYTAVGGDWYWRDRLAWSHADWLRWLDRPELQTWVLYDRGTPAGYVELEKQPGDDVEIAYFGLIPRFIASRSGRTPADGGHPAGLGDAGRGACGFTPARSTAPRHWPITRPAACASNERRPSRNLIGRAGRSLARRPLGKLS